MARAAWRQDARLAARVVATCPALAGHLDLEALPGRVVIRDPVAFRSCSDRLHAEHLEQEKQFIEEHKNTVNVRDGAKCERKLGTVARRAALWLPWGRMMRLQALIVGDTTWCGTN